MKTRYRKFRRGNVWWCQDNESGKQESLRTKDKTEALRLLDIRNQPTLYASHHLQLARTHLLVSKAESITRTWQNVLDALLRNKKGKNRSRWERIAKSKPFDIIRNRAVVETDDRHFFDVLEAGAVSTNVYLRRLHNYALDMNWLLAPVIPKPHWPSVEYKDKRAITITEHQSILAREKNPERKAYYEICWHIGGSQSDMAALQAENIDWQNRILRYTRQKSNQPAEIHIGSDLEKVLRSLPVAGALFPNLSKVRESDRATEFKQRCTGLEIAGVTLHSYRYSWAERALTCGFPERFAQVALGHGNKHLMPSSRPKAVQPRIGGGRQPSKPR